VGWERWQWVGVEGSGRGEGEEGRGKREGKSSPALASSLPSPVPPHPYVPYPTRLDPISTNHFKPPPQPKLDRSTLVKGLEHCEKKS